MELFYGRLASHLAKQVTEWLLVNGHGTHMDVEVSKA